jgi:hypothetical protein
MEFTIALEVKAPASFVTEWWLANGPGLRANPGNSDRTSMLLPTGQTRTVTETLVGSRRVRQDGVLTREGPTGWVYRVELWTNGSLIAREETRSAAVESGKGCRFTTNFRFDAVGGLRRFLLWTSGRTLRRHREEAYNRYLATLERAYAADPGRPRD